MGVLGMAGSGGDSEPVDDVDPVGGEATDQQQEPAPERERAENGTFVPATALKPQAQGSRRNKTQEQIDAALEAHKTALKAERDAERQQWQNDMATERAERQRLANEHARMQGALEEMRRQPAAQAQSQGPDPAELRRKAREALASNNIDEYERLRDQANDIIAERKADERVRAYQQEQQRSQPAQVPAHIQTMIYAHQNVARAGERGIQAVMLKDQELALYGHAPGPQRQQKAFELADKMLGGMGQQATAAARPAGFSSDAAAALGGVTAAGRSAAGGTGGQGDGVQLSGIQENVWRRAGFKSAAEYVQWMDPHKHGLA